MPGMSFDRHGAIDVALGRSILVEMSAADIIAELDVSVDDNGQYRTSLRSSSRPIIFPPDETLTLVGDLADLHREFGTNLTHVRYTYSKLPTGRWRMQSRFDYGTQ